uniref:Uncharacterized protein n=1 Tax=Pristionchus pacificus TaxID=54126 RepID=A0A2A6B423_PRIPA|eukprot:PDM60627.1 hypothetical protein PRIPAC_52089 [Pristionchus pacificus]
MKRQEDNDQRDMLSLLMDNQKKEMRLHQIQVRPERVWLSTVEERVNDPPYGAVRVRRERKITGEGDEQRAEKELSHFVIDN